MTENNENCNIGGTEGPSGGIDIDLFGMAHIHGQVNEDGSISMPADELFAHCWRIFRARLITLAGIYFKQSEGGK